MIEVLRNTSMLVKTLAPGIVYKNVNIWIGTYAVIMFKIPNSWLESKRLEVDDVMMIKWDGRKWIQLETKEKSRDGTYRYYEAKTTEFSPFAITGLKESISAVTQSEATPMFPPRVNIYCRYS